MKRKSGPTPMVSFRFRPKERAELAWLVKHLTGESGNPLSASDVLRLAIRELYLRRGGKP